MIDFKVFFLRHEVLESHLFNVHIDILCFSKSFLVFVFA